MAEARLEFLTAAVECGRWTSSRWIWKEGLWDDVQGKGMCLLLAPILLCEPRAA